MEKILGPQKTEHGIKSEKVDTWLAGNFAKGWLKDALDEAKNKGRDPRRREIIFAVCFAESYLIEWIRDIVYEGDFPKFKKFITNYNKITAKQKWKDVVKDLQNDDRKGYLIKKTIDYKMDRCWSDFCTLVDYRDALAHATTSLPECSTKQETGKKFFPPSKLSKLKPGWAIKVVINLAKSHHGNTETQPLNWFKKFMET